MNTYSNKTGKVYLVGAGPSDMDLLTLKGRRLIEQAQVIIYDALIGLSIEALFPQQAEKISVGKRAGRHSMKQEEINQIIVDKALEGKMVVRLKGGDPFLFGRGGEELEMLLEHHIPYEIVPGVTSATAVLAYAGIPMTHRGMASGVHIMTGHKQQNKPLDIDFRALKNAGGTCVFLMGISAMHDITQGFLQAGMPPETPAAVLQDGTSARQRQVIASLATLEEEAKKQQIGTPAVIVIGETVALGERYAWRDKLPLSNRCILVTRPVTRSRQLAQSLRNLGAEVLEVPAIRTQIRDCTKQLLDVLNQMDNYEYMVFTSPAGVDYFFELLYRMDLDIRCIKSVKLAVIGSATGDALRKRGLKPDRMPEEYNSIALGKLINQSMQSGGKVLILRSAMGSKELIKEIQAEKQIQVTDIAIYDTIYKIEMYEEQKASDHAEEISGIRTLIENGRIDMVMFTSSSTVRGFVQMTEGLDQTKVQAVCIGCETAKQAASYGMQVYQAETETIESMVQAAILLSKKC